MPLTLTHLPLSDDECASGPVVIKFTATWCQPCKRIQPLFEQLASQYESSICFAVSDVDKEDSLAARANIRSLPTFLFLLNGVEQNRVEGSNIDAVRQHTATLMERTQQRQKKQQDTTKANKPQEKKEEADEAKEEGDSVMQ